jgi:Xaa-Pro aminopeptidase
MQERDLDALLLIQPESIVYASGATPGIAASWRRAGAAMLLVPADARDPLLAIVGDLQAAGFRSISGIADVRTHPIWVDVADVEPDGSIAALRSPQAGAAGSRPTTFDRDLAFARLGQAVAERGLSQGRIGTEHGFLPLADAEAFETSCPDVRWSDATEVVARLRMVKSPEERAHLRLAGLAAEAGVRALAEAVRAGSDHAALGEIWRIGALAEASRLGAAGPVETWAYISVGPDGFAPGGPARAGDLIKVDVGCVVRGYSSDSARTFALGQPTPAAREIYGALLQAFESGRAALRPGVALRDVHAAATRAMHDAGFRSYARGHFGHGLGASIWSEEWPFIGADADVTVEPGMVLAFETPWYVRGVGALMIEDQFEITETGAEPLWSLPRELVQLELR